MPPLHYGIDIGGTKIELAGFDADFQLLDRWREPTPADDRRQFFATLRSMVDAADRHFGGTGTIGIGFPGIIKPDGTLLSANLPGMSGQDVRERLNQSFDRSPVIDNDCRCFTRSETAAGGAAAGLSNVFGAILGTGAGAGITMAGEMYYGEQYLAGEWGHLPLPAALQCRYDLPILECGCGQSGCLEQYIAGPGLARLYAHSGGPADSTTSDWLQAYRAGEDAAVKAHAIHRDALGAALGNVVKLLAPEAIVLGGGLSNIDEIVDDIPDAITPHCFPGTPRCDVRRPHFGDASGVRGAALLGARNTC